MDTTYEAEMKDYEKPTLQKIARLQLIAAALPVSGQNDGDDDNSGDF